MSCRRCAKRTFYTTSNLPCGGAENPTIFREYEAWRSRANAQEYLARYGVFSRVSGKNN
jgi:hypothetical protein